MQPEKEIDEAIKYLLDNDLISMGWNPEIEEITYFMTEDQKGIYDLEFPDEEPPMYEFTLG